MNKFNKVFKNPTWHDTFNSLCARAGNCLRYQITTLILKSDDCLSVAGVLQLCPTKQNILLNQDVSNLDSQPVESGITWAERHWLLTVVPHSELGSRTFRCSFRCQGDLFRECVLRAISSNTNWGLPRSFHTVVHWQTGISFQKTWDVYLLMFLKFHYLKIS